MINWLRHAVVRPLALHWLSTSRSSWRSLPSPHSTGSVSVPGPDPDRILLVGGGISVGWGTSSHDDALAGHLARSISLSTGRGAVVDVVTDDILSGNAELPVHVTQILRTVDAVVITPGDLDSILFLPAAVYRGRLERALDQITDAAPANMRVFVVGTAPLQKVLTLPGVSRIWAPKLGDALNATARRLCDDRPNAIFVPFSPRDIAGREGTGRTYSAWAELIAPPMGRQLNSCTERSIR